MRKREFLIYALLEPDTGHIRYVGKSSSGLARAFQHWQPYQLSRDSTYAGNWIRKVLASGREPGVVALQIFDSSQSLDDAEILWIAYCKSNGCRLTNHTDGGGGITGLVRSAETRKKIGDGLRGKPKSRSHREKISRFMKTRAPAQGFKRPDAAMYMRGNKNGVKNRGKKPSDEVRARISKSLGGRPIKDFLGRQYISVREAAAKLKLHGSNIFKVLRGRRSSTGGYKFEYALP